MKRKKKKSKQMILLVLSIELILIVFILFYIQFKPKVVKAVTIEAGTTEVDVKDFLSGRNIEGSFVTDIHALNLDKPGIYEVQIKVGDKIQTASLKVVDTVAPKATAVNQMILKEEEIDAQSFVTDIADFTNVTVSYVKTPDFTIAGDQEVTVALMDTSNNRSELTAMLTILDINKRVSVEVGSAMKVTTSDFVNSDKYTVSIETDLQTLDTNKPMTHEIVLNIDGRKATAFIDVVDTVPPKAEAKNLEIIVGDTPQAIDFVKNADNDILKASFRGTPDFTLLGEQAVVIVVEDESGNKSELTAVLTIKNDAVAPVITGVADKTVYIGDTISYKKGVSVTDNKDEKVEFQVDSSNVNLTKEGSYEVIYTATDSAGNKAKVIATITVKALLVSEEKIYQMAEDILDDIVTSDMSEEEIAYEIYRWTKGHIAYTGSSDKSDWRNEAYRGIKNAVGDCFTYFAVSKALLNQAGIDNRDVTRLGGTTRHYWSLVNTGKGWYHFDSCPNKDHKNTFMMTDAEADEYTQIRGNNYYSYDKSLYTDITIE